MRALAPIALLLAAAAIGCPSPPPPAPRLSAIQDAIFTPSCTFSSCHSSEGNAGGLVLVSGQSFMNLVGVPANQPGAADAGLLRVDPGNPDASFLMIKLRPGTPAIYDDHMPDTGQQLDDGDVNAIAQWISLGAQND